MPEILHRGQEQHIVPVKEMSAFPHVTFHFSPHEYGLPAPVYESDSTRPANTCASYIRNALTHPSRVVVMGGPLLPETIILMKSEEGVQVLSRKIQEDGSAEVISRQFGEKPAVHVWFDDEMDFRFKLVDADQSGQRSLTVTSAVDDGFIIFVGTVEHDLRKRYVHSGGRKNEAVVSQSRSKGAFNLIKKEIEQTESDEKKGVLREHYLERISESGGILYYRERSSTETKVEEYTALTDRSVILVPGDDSWHFSRYHEHLHLPI